ncbi:MAG: YjbQ family protein [Deltaproteobacteria bacterium]|nr:YjbQ family protein [Deltaproteobacteria bacterium]
MIIQRSLAVETRGQGFTDLTQRIQEIVAASGVALGLCHVFVQHTSASLLVQENADPTVRSDLMRFLERLIDHEPFLHTDEGPDDMPAHVKNALLRTSETLPVSGGRLALGTWQALYLVEHRSAPHTRKIVVTVSGS